MKSDIEIAQESRMQDIEEIASSIGLSKNDIEQYGRYKAKISSHVWDKIKDNEDGKLILVTAINPTPAGEGKTTTSVGLADALHKLKKKVILTLREPSLGPCFGIKGGACGGGYAQVVPMEDINLHFTGDFHAITSAHNLLAAIIDNHIHQGNQLNIDPRRVTWKRVLDINDRSLRHIVTGLGGKAHGVPRESGFDITVASEIMTILVLSQSINDLKSRINQILVGYTYNDQPVHVEQLNCAGALTTLLKDAIKPNLVQTLEHTPTFIHCGPFANISLGTNSIRATKFALKLSDYVVTEAGFGADLGAEKFFDIKCQAAGLHPNAVVIVATIRALKMHGDPSIKNKIQLLNDGMQNLKKHIINIKKFGLPIVVALNVFEDDNLDEIFCVENLCKEMNVEFAVSEVFANGSEGGLQLAEKVMSLCERSNNFSPIYDRFNGIKNKIEIIAKEIYGANEVIYTPLAQKQLNDWNGSYYVCIAKTQYSLSDNPKLLGRPKDFNITVRELRVYHGAKIVVALTGDIMTMPGLPKHPAAEKIDIDNNGIITGLS